MELKTLENWYEDWIAAAKTTLKIPEEEFAQCKPDRAIELTYRTEEKFVDGHTWIWLWDKFLSVDFSARHGRDMGSAYLHQFLPEPNAFVCFVVQPFGEKKHFSIYSALAKHIEPVLMECPYFEYYVVEEDLNWLFCENHHGAFNFIGAPVSEIARLVVARNSDEWATPDDL